MTCERVFSIASVAEELARAHGRDDAAALIAPIREFVKPFVVDPGFGFFQARAVGKNRTLEALDAQRIQWGVVGDWELQYKAAIAAVRITAPPAEYTAYENAARDLVRGGASDVLDAAAACLGVSSDVLAYMAFTDNYYSKMLLAMAPEGLYSVALLEDFCNRHGMQAMWPNFPPTAIEVQASPVYGLARELPAITDAFRYFHFDDARFPEGTNARLAGNAALIADVKALLPEETRYDCVAVGLATFIAAAGFVDTHAVRQAHAAMFLANSYRENTMSPYSGEALLACACVARFPAVLDVACPQDRARAGVVYGLLVLLSRVVPDLPGAELEAGVLSETYCEAQRRAHTSMGATERDKCLFEQCDAIAKFAKLPGADVGPDTWDVSMMEYVVRQCRRLGEDAQHAGRDALRMHDTDDMLIAGARAYAKGETPFNPQRGT
jgi:hypothetical protein